MYVCDQRRFLCTHGPAAQTMWLEVIVADTRVTCGWWCTHAGIFIRGLAKYVPDMTNLIKLVSCPGLVSNCFSRCQVPNGCTDAERITSNDCSQNLRSAPYHGAGAYSMLPGASRCQLSSHSNIAAAPCPLQLPAIPALHSSNQSVRVQPCPITAANASALQWVSLRPLAKMKQQDTPVAQQPLAAPQRSLQAFQSDLGTDVCTLNLQPWLPWPPRPPNTQPTLNKLNLSAGIPVHNSTPITGGGDSPHHQ